MRCQYKDFIAPLLEKPIERSFVVQSTLNTQLSKTAAINAEHVTIYNLDRLSLI